MIRIELDTTKKIQLGIMAAVVCVIGYFVVSNWGFWSGKKPNLAITSWTEARQVAVDPKRPLGPTNPADPSRAAVVTVFANHDGQLEIVETGPEDARRVGIKFKEDTGRTEYNTYRNQWDKLAKVKDPARRVLTYSAYSFVERGGRSMLGWAQLSKEQAGAEREARVALKESLVYIHEGTTDGSFEQRSYKEVMKALADYRQREGDPMKDKVKGELANKVMEAGIRYSIKVQEAQLKEVEIYVDAVYALLKDEQKQKIGEAAKYFAARPTGAGPSGPRRSGKTG